MGRASETYTRGETGSMDRLKQLKADLAAGKITLEQYKTQAKAILAEELGANRITQQDHDTQTAEVEATTATPAGGGASGGGALTAEDVQRMIQSETDKVRTQYANEKKALQDELDKLKTAKMSDEEKAKFEADKLTTQLAAKEADLLNREVKLHTVDKLREANLPIEFRDILAGVSVEETDKRIVAFQAQWQTAIKAAVDERFKAGGSNPNGDHNGGGGGSDVNPWNPQTLNLTRQAQILRESPDKARSMASAFGVTLDY